MEQLKGSITLFLQKYRLEAIFLGLAIIICLVSGGIFLSAASASDSKEISQDLPTKVSAKKEVVSPSSIYIDMSGAVEKPDLYKLTSGDRLKDALDEAGGLSDKADKTYFAQNFNLSRVLVDQEKIYIPTLSDVVKGVITSETNTDNNSTSDKDESGENKVAINSASLEELDGLAGIGKTIGQKIIDNRPFTTVEELVEKKIVGQKVFDGIKEHISL